LIDSELDACWAQAVQLDDLRPAVCLAEAEAAAWSSEMPHIRSSDLDLEAGTVRIHGGATTRPRLGRLTERGSAQLRRRIARIGPDEGSDPVLMGEGQWDDPDEGRAAATMALVGVLKRARLSGPGVNPRSIALWAGTKVLAKKGTVEAVALALGVKSLDASAAMVGHSWWETGAE
jgi:hypothetical protein